MLKQLLAAGMDVARLNLSHGTPDEHSQRLRELRKMAAEAGRSVAALLDLPGPKIRIGAFAEGRVDLARGGLFTLTIRSVAGTASEVTLGSEAVFAAVKPGQRLFLADGLLELRVTQKTGTDLVTRVISGGELASHQGVSLPGVSLDVPSMTAADREGVRFGVQEQVDWIATSFVRTAADVAAVRCTLQEFGSAIPIIAKIEKHEAITHLDAILQESDGVMVARGDLGVELPIHDVPRIQKEIIRRAGALGRPVVTATQMLDSMIRCPRPTRAEVSDVANAVLDGTDCVMLSGETAAGRYPLESVRTMSRVVSATEPDMDHSAFLRARAHTHVDSVTNAISAATVELAADLKAAAIITCTSSGYTARMVSRYRPRTPIIGVTSSPATFRRLSLVWGVRPLLLDQGGAPDETIERALEAVLERNLVRPGSLVVVTAGMMVGQPGNTNLLRVERL